MARPLEKLRILDLTWVLSGPFGMMVLCDLGAEVIKIERPGSGDQSRSIEPVIDSVSAYFFSLNRGKKSVVIDLTKEKGKELFLELVKKCDVVAENFTPGTMDRLGLGYETLRKHNPGLIYAACSGFGQTGPDAQKPALDVVAQGRSGVMSITGEEDGPPVRAGVSIGDISTGMLMALAILAAVYERMESGQGQMIDVSMVDSLVALEENAFVRYFATGEVPRKLGTKHPVMSPFQAFATKDGYMTLVATGPIEQWAMFLDKIDRLDLLSDDRFQEGRMRYKYNKELEPILSEALKKKTTAEWIREFESIGVPCGPLNSIPEAASDPQILARNMFVDLPCPGIKKGSMRVVNTPIKLSRTAVELEQGAPALGEHTVEVLSTLLGMSLGEIGELERQEIIETAKGKSQA
ncbi:CaiB/BaiF CoA transferase family protein [Chloroflexota bacterium]